ncbi:dTDP-4-dehydrorhamnose 3,5-epimerase [Ralstonia sp. 24A2]|uniref:dTDP-4-dehydrorhamnose 3,5-epimerase n=1 Tax=Ralstonia sp. 24A2 TaxID=3447364 RepID=UPI003F6A4C0D
MHSPKAFFLPRFPDERGEVMEVYHREHLHNTIGCDPTFVQDIIARSNHQALRGLHYQLTEPQGKLVTVIEGGILDVAVDLRLDSAQFLTVYRFHLESHGKFNSVWIPEGFAHGYLVTSTTALVHYKVTRHRDPEAERRILWSDPALRIEWPVQTPILSIADQNATTLEVALEELRAYAVPKHQ